MKLLQLVRLRKSLRATLAQRWGWITVILFLGLVLPLLLATWFSLNLQQKALIHAHQLEMDNMANVLANGLSEPIWNLIPQTGGAIVASVMEDPRVVSVTVTSKAQRTFIDVERAPKPNAKLRTIVREVVRGGDEIGQVTLVVDAADSTEVGWITRWRIALVGGIQLLLSLGVVLFIVVVVRRLEREALLRQANEDLRSEINERRLAEQAMRESEERFRSVIENSPSILALKDLGGRFRLVNHRYEDWLGIDAVTLIGKTPAEIFEPEIAKRWTAGDKVILDQKQPFDEEFDVPFADGAVHHLRVTKFPVFGPNNVLTGIAEIGIDLTGQRKAEDSLRQSQKLKAIGQLTGGVAHDFNNLLAVVLGNLELLRDQLSDEHQLKMIDAGINATSRGADLTKNMLAFARKARLTPKLIDLNLLVNETRQWIGRTLPANISVETSLLPGLWQIKADPSSTESALLNLILNARDAMPHGGQLSLETANIHVDQAYIDTHQEELEPGRYVMLAVTDTGHGIAPTTVDQIFEPFYSTKPTGSGSGLGLSMVMGFMKQSSGTVQVESELGKGTTFKLFFGAQSESAKVTPKRTTSNESKVEGRRILVAEDEPEVLAVIVATLKKAGYSVFSATSGDQAREIFEADQHFDMLLTDIAMPGKLQGTDLAAALRKIDPNLPIVFMSGYAPEATVQAEETRPEDIRLTKPVRRAKLLDAVNAVLREC